MNEILKWMLKKVAGIKSCENVITKYRFDEDIMSFPISEVSDSILEVIDMFDCRQHRQLKKQMCR